LERAIERGSHAGYHFAVLFVDLDGFKNMNDRFGHIEGDRLLVAAAHRMVEAVRPQDMVARRDGDEFTLLLDDLDHPDDAIGVADRIIQHLQLPLTTDDAAPLTISASIGIALGGAGTGFAQDLIARADAAMYRAKAAGGGRYVLAAPSGPDSDGGSPKQARQLPR
jgi:diguanylate cyclase (GGDEF)-like protein